MKISNKTKIIIIKIPFSVFFYIRIKKLINFINFIFDLFKFIEHNDGRFPVKMSLLSPQLLDRATVTKIEPHYTYHPAWAARVLAKTRPESHVDFSSFIQFSTLVSAFIPIKFYDYRPANIKLENLKTMEGDLLSMPFESKSVMSLSCMHTVEHVGLGRYGDPVDPQGDLKAIKELKRVLAVGGTLLFVVPVGESKIIFNAHRSYSYDQIMDYFSDLHLEEFSLIPDNAVDIGMIKNATKQDSDKQENGCGCFWFIKK